MDSISIFSVSRIMSSFEPSAMRLQAFLRKSDSISSLLKATIPCLRLKVQSSTMVETMSLESSLDEEKTKIAALNADLTSSNWKVISVAARVPPITIINPGILKKVCISPPIKMAEMIRVTPAMIPDIEAMSKV